MATGVAHPFGKTAEHTPGTYQSATATAPALLPAVHFAHEGAARDDDGAVLGELRRRHVGGLIVAVTHSGRGLPSRVRCRGRGAAAPLPLLGARAPAVRVGLPPKTRTSPVVTGWSVRHHVVVADVPTRPTELSPVRLHRDCRGVVMGNGAQHSSRPNHPRT